MKGILLTPLTCLFLVASLAACSKQSSDPEPVAPAAAAKSAAAQSPGTEVLSETGAYAVTLQPQSGAVRIGSRQPWVARITDASGTDFTPNSLYFDGGMPGHGHGLSSAPQFTQHLGGSDYLLEGLVLNMPGDWRFVVTVGGPAGVDSAVFNFNLQPDQIEGNPAAQATLAWNPNELALINSLRLRALPQPTDLSNRFMHIPEAIKLGQALFNSTGLSATGNVSCATCHDRALGFADGKKLGFGSATTKRHTPALTGVAHANWFYWDGRRDSLWAQAVTPIETPGEMDNNRTDAVLYVFSQQGFAAPLLKLTEKQHDFSDTTRFPLAASPFGAGKLSWHRMAEHDKQLVNDAFATIGKLIASYEATLQHAPGRFDAWADELLGDGLEAHQQEGSELILTPAEPLTATEQAGLRLFLDIPRTQCLRCHNGPQFTNQGFHNVATSEPLPGTKGSHDFGRMRGLQAVLVDPFNCSGSYSDAGTNNCEHLRFARRQNLGETIDGAFKVPSLRNLRATAPYFHDGRFDTLTTALDHYRNQLGDDPLRNSEVPDIDLSDTERDQLIAFLLTL